MTLAASPIVIAHRGACGYIPEHTLASYAMAILQGADYIEPDLVMSRDGVLIARHDNDLGLTTNVADHPEFADRYRENSVDGELCQSWFSEDFTLKELKTLRCIERIASIRPANTRFNNQFEIATFDEILQLLKRLQGVAGRPVGIYPEIKHPSHFQALDLAMEQAVVRQLNAAGFDGPNALVYIQSFEIDNLKYLRSITELPLLQLLWIEGCPFDQAHRDNAVSYQDMATAAGLAAVAAYATAVGPEKNHFILAADANNDLHACDASNFIDDAHKAGLLVHPYTFRAENHFLPNNFTKGDDTQSHGQLINEIQLFLELGVDGFFTDFPDIGRHAVDSSP